MPASLTFHDFHQMYVAEVGRITSETYGHSQFSLLLRAEFPQVTKGRRSSFAQCSLCNALQAVIGNVTISTEQKEMAQDRLRLHLEQVKVDRAWFLDRSTFASHVDSEVCVCV